jgi:hypothetical protein
VDLIVVDSVVLIDHVRGVAEATALLDRAADAVLMCSGSPAVPGSRTDR